LLLAPWAVHGWNDSRTNEHPIVLENNLGENMIVEIKVPSVGESVTEATLAEWFKRDGDTVQKDEPLFVIETDKVTLEVVAESDGLLSIKVAAGETVAIGEVVGAIDTEAAQEAVEKQPEEEKKEPQKEEAEKEKEKAEGKPLEKEPEKERASVEETPQEEEKKAEKKTEEKEPEDKKDRPPPPHQSLAPSVRNLIAQKNIDISKIEGTGPDGRITRGDVLLYIESTAETKPEKKPAEDRKADTTEKRREKAAEESQAEKKQTSRKPMSPIRRRIAKRLLEAKQNTAMLTTFNEIDMRHVQDIRARFKESFKEKHGVSLGLMSFFIKATTEALKEYPEVNAFIDHEEIVYHHYYHIGIAVGAEKGLVVPVIRHADKLSFAELEQAIVDYVNKIRDNRLELADLEGGTFTITNGGVYGSLLSTPILNMPQSGILGMHKIEKRPVAVAEKIEIRPMMYVALSYDHRIIDGREAVSFLKRIKEYVENPEQMMMEM
jgi:2-oxoglutarate dehydrogenase E2 component (dihydrolipoamide succinyltransferase)